MKGPTPTEEKKPVSATSSQWGHTDGKEVFLYRLSNANGIEMNVTNYGAIVQSIMVPDKGGRFDDVVLGYDGLDGYINDPYYMGAVVGRYAGRISGARVNIEGREFKLTKSPKGFHHHGGAKGFNKVVWSGVEFATDESAGVTLRYHSASGEEGFPGNLDVAVTYLLNNQNEWHVNFVANTDEPTIINLTQHSYFNLKGYSTHPSDIHDHLLTMHTEWFLPVTPEVTPMGKIESVKTTPFDFLSPHRIGDRIDDKSLQMAFGFGYDHTFVLKTENSDELKPAATIHEPVSGRVMKISTTEPSVHFYSSNFLEANRVGKNREAFRKHAAFCLETQHAGDSPHHTHFPSTLLFPGQVFKSTTIHKFEVAEF